MANADRVIVGITHGNEDPDRVLVPYLVAGAALDQGKEVVIWLTVDAVRLALDGYVDDIRADMDPSIKRVHDQFVEKGGRFYVCPICFGERDLDEGALVESAELKGATPLMEFAAQGALTFTY